jgi:hypothetical protein
MDGLPIRKKTLALWRTKSNSSFDGISLAPFAVCIDFGLRYWKRSSKLGSSFSEIPTESLDEGDQESATVESGDYHQLNLTHQASLRHTINTLTARSLLPKVQKAQLASHR